eukprot:CAMPEP_0180416286 /NCGR_PEP_ID=MMETSP1036_2-20121128/397_1 /TAXON_ID=632150 /ORGANISM="Azadinium spinosum, Strain 3D9" /LENGTH=288 /DNA_ID=CAMNT_0022421195 /DNA_START=33 /DNA_END=896 /DNA_ORIENTATION=-
MTADMELHKRLAVHQKQCLSAETPLLMRFMAFFCALHPLAWLWQSNYTLVASSQSMLLMAHTLGSVMASALFFATSGQTVSSESPAECQLEDTWRSVAFSMVVGLLSELISSVPVFFLLILTMEGSVRRLGTHSTGQKRTIEEAIALCIAVAYTSACSLYTATFIANVSPQDANKWILSACAAVMTSQLTMPTAKALAWAILTREIVRHPDICREANRVLVAEPDVAWGGGNAVPSHPSVSVYDSLEALGEDTGDVLQRQLERLWPDKSWVTLQRELHRLWPDKALVA